MLRPYFAAGDPFPGDPDDLLDELVVAVTRDARGLGEARIHRWIGENPGQRVQLDDVGNSEAIHAHVDAAPIPAPQGTVGVQGDALRLTAERFANAGRRTLENLERMLACVPDPFRLVPVYGRRARRQCGEIESDDRQAAHVAV